MDNLLSIFMLKKGTNNTMSLCNKYDTRANITNYIYHNVTTGNITTFLCVKSIYIPLRRSFYMYI